MVSRSVYAGIFFLVIVSLFLVTGDAIAGKEKGAAPRVDYLAVATKLILDGFPNRAIAMLSEIDPEKEGLNTSAYYTIRGLAYSSALDFKKALSDFQKAISEGSQDQYLYIYLANCHYRLREYREAIEALDHAGELGWSKPKYFLLRAACFWRMKKPHMALYWLEEGNSAFPYERVFFRQRFYYLMELGLHRQATIVAMKYIASGEPSPKDYISIAKAFIGSGRMNDALAILWEGILRFDLEPKIQLALASTYARKRQIIPAASRFEELSLLDPSFSKDAAELYKRAGQYVKALYLNSRVVDQRAKMLQRLGILLDLRADDMIKNMFYDLKRQDLFSKDEVKYAYAYSLFQARDLEGALHFLKGIKDKRFFSSALTLRQLIDQCREDPLLCP